MALETGSATAHLCLQSLSNTNNGQIASVLSFAINLLEKYSDDRYLLHPVALRSLVIGTATLLACSAVHSDSSTIVPYVIRLLRAGLDNESLGILLFAFGVARADHPRVRWRYTASAPLKVTKAEQVKRAIEVIAFYAPALDLGSIPHETMKNLGLLELLSGSREYNLVDKDFQAIYTEFESTWADKVPVLHTFPPTFNLAQYVIRIITDRASNSDAFDDILTSQASVQAYLDVLRCTYDQSVGAPTPQVYVFVLESLCRASSHWVEVIGEQLVRRFPRPELSEDLGKLIASRNIVSLLGHALESNSMRVKTFATAHVCLFIELLLRNPNQLKDSWTSLMGDLFQCEELCRPGDRLKAVKNVLESPTRIDAPYLNQVYGLDSASVRCEPPLSRCASPGHIAGAIIPRPSRSKPSSPPLSALMLTGLVPKSDRSPRPEGSV